VLADLLIERRDPRGEFIMNQCRGSLGHASRLLEQNRARWTAHLPPWVSAYSRFRRGFIELAMVTDLDIARDGADRVAKTIVERAPALLALTPIPSLFLADIASAAIAPDGRYLALAAPVHHWDYEHDSAGYWEVTVRDARSGDVLLTHARTFGDFAEPVGLELELAFVYGPALRLRHPGAPTEVVPFSVR
jgi:hypothetical protein